MIYYETEMEIQKTIREINKPKGKKAENYIKNKATRTGSQFKKGTNTSSREKQKLSKEIPEKKNNQTGIKDERTCYTCGTKGRKIKDCESKLNIQRKLKHTRTEEYNGAIVKSIQIKEVQKRKNKQTRFVSQRKEKHKKLSQK